MPSSALVLDEVSFRLLFHSESTSPRGKAHQPVGQPAEASNYKFTTHLSRLLLLLLLLLLKGTHNLLFYIALLLLFACYAPFQLIQKLCRPPAQNRRISIFMSA